MKQSGTIFDLVDSPGEEGYMEMAERSNSSKDSSFFSSMKEFGKSFLKGGLEGITKLGRMMGPLESNYQTPEQITQSQEEALEYYLPTENESFPQKVVRRGLREAPSMLAFPGSGASTAARTSLAAMAGQTAEELGAPEWVQTIAEISSYVGPDVTQKLLEKGKNKELIALGRKLGMSDEALTPLIQSEIKQKVLTKAAYRRGSTERALERSKKELGKGYEELKKSGNVLTQDQGEKLVSNIDSLLEKMPSGVRSKITQDYKDLLNKPLSDENLMNFWADINYEVGPSTKQLSLLKQPIKDSLKEISPELAKDFEIQNKLYSNYAKIAQRLKPNLTTDLLGASQALGMLSSIIFGYYPPLLKFAGGGVARKIAGKLLTDPKWQQLSHKTSSAILQNKYPIALKTLEALSKKIEKYDPDTSKELNKISEEELKEFFS